jgi:hypothetical protein
VLLSKESLTLVGLEESNLDLTIGQANNEFRVALIWPGHARDRGSLGELVADGLLVSPLRSETIDEDYAVGLGHSKLLGVWRKG